MRMIADSMKRKEGLIPPTNKTPYYQCRFYNSTGELCRRSTGKTDYHAAWHVYQNLRKGHEQAPDTDDSYTLGGIIADYEGQALSRIKSKRSHATSCKALYRYWAPSTPWSEICNAKGPNSINQYQEWRAEQVKASTIRRELAVLSAAAEHAIRSGLDIRNPRNMIKINITKTTYYYLTHDQASRLLEATLQSTSAAENKLALHDFTKISLYTGMRTGEVLHLTTNRVSFTHRYLYLDDSKGNKPHAIPISEEIEACLQRRIEWAKHNDSDFLFVNPKTKTEDQPAKPFGSFITPFKSACKRAGIPVSSKHAKTRGMRVYDLRHTFATWLVQDGVSIERVSDMLNHSDIKTTQVYAHHSPTGRASTVKRLPKL